MHLYEPVDKTTPHGVVRILMRHDLSILETAGPKVDGGGALELQRNESADVLRT